MQDVILLIISFGRFLHYGAFAPTVEMTKEFGRKDMVFQSIKN